MPDWQREIPFGVDIAGVIEIMGASLYSRPDTPVRELIQNAHDGVMRRRQVDLGFTGRIDVRQDAAAGTLSFADDGVGLTAEQAEQYLGTLGVGITGILKRGVGITGILKRGALEGDAGTDRPAERGVDRGVDSGSLIGQFGIGLFSAFMLADRVVVETRHLECDEGVRWAAGSGTEITLSSHRREGPGTTVVLNLKPEHRRFAEDAELLEAAVREYADFLPVPVFVNDSQARTNVINVAWFDPTPDREAVELELEGYFHETPLDVLPLRIERPASIAGALYVTPQRTPGFAGEATVAVTIRRMVISRKVQGLLPEWASFLRGVLELNDNAPTASREDIVRDTRFALVKDVLEELLFGHFEQLAEDDLTRLQATIGWHRYTFAGAALTEPRLRELLRRSYRWTTSQGPLTFDEILSRSPADALLETDAEYVVWYNVDRRQERWANSLFAEHPAPCVHAIMSFEESLLSAMTADANARGVEADLRIASPGAPRFAETVLGVRDVEEADSRWQEFLNVTGAKVFCASFRADQPVMAFLNERRELMRTFDDLKQDGDIPSGFQRMIDQYFDGESPEANEVLLNRNHRLVERALEKSTSHPLASVLRLLVMNALSSAGAVVDRGAYQTQADDLDWIAEALWGRD